MAIKKLLLSLCAMASVAAFAQAPIGTVTSVQGVATATQGTTGVTVTPGTPVQNGMRFVTTTSGTVTLSLNGGCTVVVPPGHSLTVLQSMSCQQLVASVEPSTSFASQTGPFGSGMTGADAVILAGAIAVTAGVISAASDDNNNATPISGR